jgi:hypothetical protein
MPGDTSIASAGIKACCACGTDVAGQARMKDSQGRYWCMPCGQADERRKLAAATHLNCAACHKLFPKGKLDKDGDHWFCKACLKKRTRVAAAHHPSAPGTHAGMAAAATTADAPASDRRRTILLAAVLIVLLLISVLFNFIFAE